MCIRDRVNELWKNYQHYAEKFYDLIKLNNEFREYDFKKNLEIKTHLCEAAEKLADEEEDVYKRQPLGVGTTTAMLPTANMTSPAITPKL